MTLYQPIILLLHPLPSQSTRQGDAASLSPPLSGRKLTASGANYMLVLSLPVLKSTPPPLEIVLYAYMVLYALSHTLQNVRMSPNKYSQK